MTNRFTRMQEAQKAKEQLEAAIESLENDDVLQAWEGAKSAQENLGVVLDEREDALARAVSERQ